MSRTHFEELAWLPAPPEDFRAQCRALREAPSPGRAARLLATHALDSLQLASLVKIIGALQSEGVEAAPMAVKRSGFAVQPA